MLLQLKELHSVQKQLVDFVEEFAPVLGRSDRRRCCGQYLAGLILDGERKSIGPMASRLPEGNAQALQQFVTDSPWDADAVQDRIYQRMVRELGNPAGVLVLDDTAVPKKGKESVGVAHQSCGALGKQSNCQALVSWQYATEQVHFPVKAELYLV